MYHDVHGVALPYPLLDWSGRADAGVALIQLDAPAEIPPFAVHVIDVDYRRRVELMRPAE